MFVTINGQIVDTPDASLSVLDRGFLLGDGIFETLRIYSGRAFKLDEHLDRIGAAARRCEMKLREGIADMVRSEVDRAKSAGLAEAFLRITLTRGSGFGLGANHQEGNIVTIIDVLPKTEDSWFTHGIRLAISSGKKNEFSETAGLKTTNYAESILAYRSARARGYDDALFLDTQGHCAEATASNIFLYLDNNLLTPPLECGVLPGITRAAVIDLASDLGITVIDDRPVTSQMMSQASEVFLTSSLKEVVPVVALEANSVGTGTPGKITRQVMHTYSELVKCST